MVQITAPSLSIGILFTSIFLSARSIQSISSWRSWLNLDYVRDDCIGQDIRFLPEKVEIGGTQ